jgi:hypothetical protein
MAVRPPNRKTNVSPGQPSASPRGDGLAKPEGPERTPPTHVSRKDGRTLKRMTLYLPVELARQLAIHCAEREIDMSAVVTDAVRAHIAAGE